MFALSRRKAGGHHGAMDAMLTPSAATAADPARRGQALMIAAGLVLGTVGVFVEEAGQGPLMAVWSRCAFGALALLAWGAATGRLHELRLSGRAWLPALASGVLMLLNWGLFFAAIGRTSIAVATVVFHVQPLLVMAFAAWWWRERIGPLRAGAALLALLGLTLASGLAQPGGAAVDTRYLVGIAMCLGGAFSYAGVTLIAKAAPGVTAYALAFWQCAVGAVLLVAWPLADGAAVSGGSWLWLAGLGVVHTGLAYVLLYAGMARLPASRVALLQFVYPAAAIVVDRLVYGRALGAVQLLGVALMAAALLAVRRR